MKNNKLLKLLILAGLGVSAVGCGNKNNSTPNTTTSSSSSSSVEVCTTEEDNKVHLVLLTGQSGARGKALNSDLSEEEKEPNFDVDIIADGLMMPSLSNIPETINANVDFREVKGGFGDTSNEFGPEMGIAQTLASRYPKDGEARKSVIVKYTACGSTMIADWYTKSLTESETHGESLDYKQARSDDDGNIWGPLTWNFFQLVDHTIASLKDEGYEAVIDGCVFIHGEQDTKFDANMALYEEGLDCFVKDVRSYLGDEDMPFIITEALTNSGKYCNDLRAMQKRVSDKYENCTFLTNEGLTTNTFEPWHYGKAGNYEIGNRIAAEFIAYNDTRKVVSYDVEPVKVPLNADVTLPKYVSATFDNDYSGYIKVEYTGTYDKTTEGTYEVPFKASGCQDVEGKLTVNVTNEVYVDGIMNEYEGRKSVELGDLGKVYVTKGEEGLYVSASINDKEVWTDGEAWGSGDMGQNGKNDDFRVYVSTGDASARTSICLSAANLLRVYGDGIGFDNNALHSNNWIYKKYVEGYYYRATTHGYVNDPAIESGGVDFEFYMPYDALGVEADDISLCFAYNDITSEGTRRTAVDHFYTANGYSTTSGLEKNNDSYISINELI